MYWYYCFRREVFVSTVSAIFVFLQDIAVVIIGGCIGHFICTGIAVLGGRIVAQKISVKTGMYIKREMMVMEPVLASIALRKLLQEC